METQQLTETTQTRSNTERLLKGCKESSSKFCKHRNRALFIFALIFMVAIIVIIYVYISLSSNTTTPSKSGLYGKFPSYGGNAQNQQITPLYSNVTITERNIFNLSILCIYHKEPDVFGPGVGYSGYITIDYNNRGYITDSSGYASCLDLNTCAEIWSINVASLLGYNTSTTKIGMRHTATLFNNSMGDRGIIFGAPNVRGTNFPYDRNEPCWAIALNIIDGSLLWKTNLGSDTTSLWCAAHGFMVDEDDHYAYGGTSLSTDRIEFEPFWNIQRGKMFKIDIDDGRIVDIWYSIDKNMYDYTIDDPTYPYIYRGASMWNIPAIIDDYLIFGTSNLWSYPEYIEQCLLGNYSSFPIENAYHYDVCGNDRSQDSKYWRCLEKGIYPDSFIILNKKSFEIEAAIPLQGVDAWDSYCKWQWNYGCMRVQGSDSDLSAVAAYTNPHNDKLYAAAMQKSGQFYIFEVPSGNVVITRKIGPWSQAGGGQWGIAVDETNMIAVTTITGGNDYFYYKYELADGTIVCWRTGSAHGIDLNTGYTIWQVINPWGTINNCSDLIFDNYIDITVNESCERDIDGNPTIKNASQTAFDNVVIPPIDEMERGFVNSSPGMLIAPVTISRNLVFIPSYSGDIFVHNLFNGTYIATLKCPKVLFNGTYFARDIIKGGVTIIEDRVIFHCGDTEISQIVSMRLFP